MATHRFHRHWWGLFFSSLSEKPRLAPCVSHHPDPHPSRLCSSSSPTASLSASAFSCGGNEFTLRNHETIPHPSSPALLSESHAGRRWKNISISAPLPSSSVQRSQQLCVCERVSVNRPTRPAVFSDRSPAACCQVAQADVLLQGGHRLLQLCLCLWGLTLLTG